MTTRIVILDSHTLTPDPTEPGETNFSAFDSLGQVNLHERTSKDQVIERCAGATAVITNKAVFDAGVIAALPELKYIGITATGTNVVDLSAASQQGITVTNVPGYGACSVAQHTFALLLELTNHVAAHNKAVHIIDPWPNHAERTATDTDSKRMIIAVEKYEQGPKTSSISGKPPTTATAN